MEHWEEGLRLGRLAFAGVAVVVVAVTGCGMSESECMGVRTEAFDVINESHTCNDDTDCLASEWPGCGKPLNVKNEARVRPLKDKFDQGKCKEPTPNCREIPEVYCKQGLCVFRETVGGENPTQ